MEILLLVAKSVYYLSKLISSKQRRNQKAKKIHHNENDNSGSSLVHAPTKAGDRWGCSLLHLIRRVGCGFFYAGQFSGRVAFAVESALRFKIDPFMVVYLVATSINPCLATLQQHIPKPKTDWSASFTIWFFSSSTRWAEALVTSAKVGGRLTRDASQQIHKTKVSNDQRVFMPGTPWPKTQPSSSSDPCCFWPKTHSSFSSAPCWSFPPRFIGC